MGGEVVDGVYASLFNLVKPLDSEEIG
jgi:hypothetical protein